MRRKQALLTTATVLAALVFGFLGTSHGATYINSVAGFLGTTTAPVNVNAAVAPTANQVLTATDATHATWQTPASSSSTLQQAYNAGQSIVTTNPLGPVALSGHGTPAPLTIVADGFNSDAMEIACTSVVGIQFRTHHGAPSFDTQPDIRGNGASDYLQLYGNGAGTGGAFATVEISGAFGDSSVPLLSLDSAQSGTTTGEGYVQGSKIRGSYLPSSTGTYFALSAADIGMVLEAYGVSSNPDMCFVNNSGGNNAVKRIVIRGTNDVELQASGSELATSYTTGGLYIPTTNGPATGTSTTRTGEAVFSYDRAGHALDVSVGATHVSMAGIVAFGRQTGQTAADGTVATYTVGSSDGSFIVSPNVNVTAATSATFSVGCAYYDETNTAQAVTFTFSSTGGTLLTSIVSLGAYEGVPVHIRAKAGTPILISTGGTFTSVTYNVEGVITQIQ